MKKLLLFAAALILAIGILPYTPLAKPFFEKRMGEKIRGQVKIGRLRLSWLGPQVFKSLQFETPDGSGSAEELQIKGPLWALTEATEASIKNGTFADFTSINGQIAGRQIQLTGASAKGHIAVQGKVDAKNQFDLNFDIAEFPVPPKAIPLFGPHVNLKGNARLDGSKGSSLFQLSSENVNTQTVKLNIDNGQGTLDLGIVTIQNGRSIASLISFLKMKPSRSMSVWFTPVAFELSDGVLRIGRIDFLLSNAIHLCLWGQVELATEQLNLNLGLPSDTLKQSFGVKGLSDTFVLKIPIRGTLSDPDIQTGPVGVKIASMIAAQQIPVGGGLLGGIAKIVTQVKEDKSIPAANRPFPWEK